MGGLWIDFLLWFYLIGCNYIIGQFSCNCYCFFYNAERTFDRKKKNNRMSSVFLL